MDKLSNDLWYYLFEYLPISGVRAIIRTCKCLNAYQCKMPEIELAFQKMINGTRFMGNRVYGGFYDPLSKYTVELIYDGYDIPSRYIISSNVVLFGWRGIIKATVSRNDLPLIKKIYDTCRQSTYPDYVAQYAAGFGFIDILEWGQSIERIDASIVYRNAIKKNQIDVVRYLMARGTISFCFELPSFENALYALRKGWMDIVNVFLLAFGDRFDILNSWQTNGHRDRVLSRKIPAFWSSIESKDLIRQIASTNPSLLTGIDVEAIIMGDYDLLMFAYEHGYMDTFSAWYKTANWFPLRNVRILKWLIDNDYVSIDNRLSYCVANGGDIECLEFLYSKEHSLLNKYLFKCIAQNCDIVTMNFLRDAGCPVKSDSLREFVKGYLNRHLHRRAITTSEFWQMAAKLEKWGCTWDEIAPMAASTGNLEILEHIRQRGYPLQGAHITNIAAETGHLNVVIWCRKNGYEWNESTCSVCCSRIDLNMLKWLRNYDGYRTICSLKSDETNICPWDNDICVNAYDCSLLDILKFTINCGCDYSRIAKRSGYKPIFDEYLATLPPYVAQ